MGLFLFKDIYFQRKVLKSLEYINQFTYICIKRNIKTHTVMKTQIEIDINEYLTEEEKKEIAWAV